MVMNAGLFRDRVIVQQEVQLPDGAGGGLQPTWTNVQTMWSNVADVSSTVLIQTMEQAQQVTHKITMRYLDYLYMPGSNRYRLIWNDVDMRIISVVNPDQTRRQIEVLAIMGQMVSQ